VAIVSGLEAAIKRAWVTSATTAEIDPKRASFAKEFLRDRALRVEDVFKLPSV